MMWESEDESINQTGEWAIIVAQGVESATILTLLCTATTWLGDLSVRQRLPNYPSVDAKTHRLR